ncbi:MAG: carbamoyltransferase HypF, partial [Thermoplasmata archaeon]|nr:carbamoyltransferase HypF [Thermoplasmata archaeon]
LGTQSVDAVAMDKHPRYSTRIAAKRLAERWGCDLFETQHYHSHAAALMVDRDVDGPIVCLTWDGTGYGDDGTSWGGETLIADLGGYRRLDTLEGIPLLGGDRAVVDPTRVVTAIELSLGRTPTMADESSVEVYSKMLPRSVRASSMGRVLDAVSCILGVCCRRTYEGEPAIKLERLLEIGEPRFEFEVGFGTSDGVSFARTMPMFDRLLDMDLDTDSRRADAVASFVRSLVRSLTERACSHAETEGLGVVGLTGGVTYNAPISNWVEEVVEERGLAFLAHERVPNGDGGISTGQNAIAGSRLG